MKKLTLKIAGLIIVVALVNLVINHAFYNKKLPYYWGNISTLNKRNYLVQNKADFNTLFIGSSKLHYQIDPVQFDSIVNSDSPGKEKIRSYNFGIDGMLPPESFYLYKSLLENDKLSFKNIIIELDFLETGDTKNIFTWRGYYWLNKETYHDYTSSMLASRYSPAAKAWNLSLVNVMAVEKLYNIGKFNEFVEFNKYNTSKDTSKEVNTLGFKALPHPKSFSPAEQQRIKEVKDACITASENYDSWRNAKENKVYANYLDQIVDLAHKKGIRLIFLFPTQWNVNQYRELFPVLSKIPDHDKIVLFDYPEHKALFENENLFDNSHVDSTGARLYTNFVAQGFSKIY